MKIKKSLLYFTSLLLMPLISAYGYLDLRQGTEQLIQTAIDFASPLFEVLVGDYSGSEFFFAKCLLLVLLYFVISFVISQTKIAGLSENRGVLFIVSLTMSILSIRFIPETDVIRAMILPYSTMGVAISLIFPFIIFGFFLHKSEIGSVGRRFGWITYVIIFLVLWNSRSYELSPLGNQIYGFMLIAAIAMVIFDKQLHEQIGLNEIKDANNRGIDRQIVHKKAEIAHLQPLAASDPMVQREIDTLNKEIRDLLKKKR